MPAQDPVTGKFVPGNGGGPGRPKRIVEEKYLKKLSSRVTIGDWQDIVDKAIEQAKDGDRWARDFLAGYLLGRPVQRSEVSGPGGGPVELERLSADAREVLDALIDARRQGAGESEAAGAGA